MLKKAEVSNMYTVEVADGNCRVSELSFNRVNVANYFHEFNTNLQRLAVFFVDAPTLRLDKERLLEYINRPLVATP